MEMYNIPEPRNDENYMIGGLDTNLHLTRPFEQVEVMYNEQAPEYFADQGLYYPTATNYGYYCTGFESSGELEDHHRFFGVDGPDIHYTGAQNESFPYVYYTPTYGYAQSPYNPYNPYIPGAFIGDDGQFVGAQAQQYFSVPQYQNVASSPAYAPVVVQPDVIPNRSPEAMFDNGSSINRPDRGGFKNNISFTSGVFQNATKSPSYQKYSLARVPEGTRNAGPIKQASFYGSVSSGSLSNPVQSHDRQGKSSSLNLPNEKVPSPYNQLKVPLSGNSLSELGSSTLGRVGPGKVRPKFNVSRALDDINSSSDALGEQNRGPRTNRSKNELAVTAYTTKEGDNNAHRNIIIYTDQYNKEDFLMDYVDAKFFVIKSYSEDDVHKSIKYNVWSSTPHGNRKLNGAYIEAQRRAAVEQKGCPVFLFFSVNMSGQFCGVAEMIGPVDFNKDMDFWQQDKWSGSFPVKWHFIKDVPNTSLRHIILENNENKPVTNSRDTQEITYMKGLEMLKIFKNHLLKTSLLDDFIYYENRQKIMQDEKARLLVRSLQSPFLVPVLGPPRKLNRAFIPPAAECVSLNNLNDDLNSSRENSDSKSVQVGSKLNIGKTIVENENSEQVDVAEDLSKLQIDSLTLDPKKADSKTSAASMANSSTGSFDVVTVGSVPLKINGITASSGFLTFGSIPLDSRALQVDKCSEPNKNGSKD